jgi:ankyrin repeat protein
MAGLHFTGPRNLLDADADPKARESLRNWSPLQVAQFNGHDEIVSILLERSDPAGVVTAGFVHTAGCDGCFCTVSQMCSFLEICVDQSRFVASASSVRHVTISTFVRSANTLRTELTLNILSKR